LGTCSLPATSTAAARPASLQTAATLFAEHTISKYGEVKSLHIILLCVTLGLVGGYVLLLLRPLQRQVEADAGRVAGLLSHVPPEVDVEAVVRGVMRGRRGVEGEEEEEEADE
jgi:Zn-dependent protease with chaperone function